MHSVDFVSDFMISKLWSTGDMDMKFGILGILFTNSLWNFVMCVESMNQVMQKVYLQSLVNESICSFLCLRNIILNFGECSFGFEQRMPVWML
jgi:hypothetical protein